MNNSRKTYIPDQGLEAIIDMVLDTGMPLLVTGEPGTGKTQLAHYIAKEYVKDSSGPLIFNTKTDSQARDLFYQYDAIRHFRDAGRDGGNTNPLDYIELSALGKAIQESGKKRAVVLIDEIDKAPRDFPNDLLYELDQMAFRIKEATPTETQDRLGKDTEVDEQGFVRLKDPMHRPIIILTSNSEKNLPDAFMRRTLYHHIEFPDDTETLIKIVEANVSPKKKFEENMLKAAIEHFLSIREEKGLRKVPATAELLSWIHYLDRKKEEINLIEALREDGDREIKRKLFRTYSFIAKNRDDLKRLKDDLNI